MLIVGRACELGLTLLTVDPGWDEGLQSLL